MSISLPAPVAERGPREWARPVPASITMLVVLGTLASFAFSWGHLVEVWRTGTFFDTDDAMRMVQVRAWLAGQGWFDMTAYRLDPPAGVFMHWSRIVDVPLALLIRLFASVMSMATAELLARIVFPLGLQVLLIAAFLSAGRALCGERALVPALIVVVLSGFQFGQFVAGRIDHHAPQITLLVAMTGAFVAARGETGWRHALVCALCMAVSLGISLENLPFIAVLVTAAAVLWLVHGGAVAPLLEKLGGSLALCVPLVFAATVSPSRYAVATSDCLSGPHVLFAILGGFAFVGLARAGRVLPTVSKRAGALVAVAVTVAGAVLLVFPTALISPYAGIDPVVREVWLSRVTEAMPLFTTTRLHPQALTLILAPLLTGLAAAICASVAETGAKREAWAVIAALTMMGLAGAAWEVRVTSSTVPIACLGGVWAVTRAFDRRRDGAVLQTLARTCLMVLPFTPFAWLLVPVAEESPAVIQSAERSAACREASAVTPLASLPGGIVFAPIDAGSHLLVHTSLSVVAAPYHRNNAGNRAAIEGFSATPPQAEPIVKATGARYVALCPGEMQATALLTRSPDGLAARLLSGDPPAWLHRIPLANTPYQVFAVD